MSLISYICYLLLLEIGIGDGLDLTCTQVYLQPGEPFIAQSKQSILIEQENNHYEFRENYHQTSITVELKIQYEFEGILLSSIIIDKVDDIYLKDICNLHFDGFYFIQCIQGLYLSNLKLFNKSNYQKSKFIVPTQTNEQCNQLYKDSNNIMVVHCFSDSHFILYFLNPIKHLFSNIKFQYFPQLSYCNRMFKQFQFDHYLHIIYQCSQWSIQVLKNGLELEVINQESMQKNFNFQLQKELENLEVCYPLLYLIDGTEYVILRFVKDNFQLLKNSDEEIGLIKKLILDMNCNIKFILTQNFNDEQKLYLQTANYLKLINYNLSTTRIEYFNKFLFLLEKNFLEVHLNFFEKEKYNINSEFIYFPPNQNYFYQFDSIQEILTLYLFSLKNWIQNPKKQFILSISTEFYECCNENEIQCFQINLENNIQTYSPAVNNLIKLEIGCDNIGTSLLNKDQFNLRLPYKINDIFSNQIRIICNIIKNEIILNNCTNLNYKNKDIIILQYSIGVDYENIVFMQNNTIYFLNCRQNQSISQIDLGNKSVLYYRNSFLAINQQQQQLEIFGFSNNSTFQFINITLKNQIDYVIQNQEKALIFFKGNLYEQPLPMIVLINQIQYPTNRYLDEKLFFNEQVYYFFYIQNLLLIQYKDFFVVKYFDNYYKIYIENIQIVAVSVRVRFELKIIAIQDSTNKLLQYCLQFSSLKLVNSYSMYDYKIIQPVKYQISQNYLSILTTQNNNKYLMIFQFEYIPDVKLEQIIKISKDQYFFISAQIFYYDAQGDFQTINLQTFKISCQLNQQNYSEMQQYNIINLELISQIDDSKIGQTNLQILTINQCQDLKPKQPKIIVKHNSNSTQIIYLADYFYGDVDKLYLNKQCNAKLSGPFIIKDQIGQCKSQSQNSEICLIYDKVQLDSNKPSQNINVPVFYFGSKQVKLQSNIIIIQTNQSNNIIIFPLNYFLIENFIIIFNIINFSLQIQIIQADSQQSTITNVDIGFLFDNSLTLQINGNIVQVENSNGKIYLYFSNGNFTQINLSQNEQLNYILNSSDFIIIEGYNMESMTLNLSIISDILPQFQIYSNFYLKVDSIFKLIQNYFPECSELDINQNFNFRFLNSYKKKSIINSQLLIKIRNKWVILDLYIDCQHQIYSIKASHFLRHYKLIESSIPYYYDEKILIILDQINGKFYLFDLRQEQQFYDSIVQMKNDFRMVIQDYNNTHYILFNPQIQEIYLIEIGYEINIINKEKTSECVLIAENNISKAEIQVFYQYEEFNNNLDQKNIIIISIIIICIFIVIIIFIIRRQKLKKHNQKLFQSISQLDQSKLQ